MGRLLACELLKADHQVSVYEATSEKSPNSCARVAAAMLSPLAESTVTEDSVVLMGLYGLKRWPILLEGLDPKVFFQQKGTIVVWHRQDVHEAKRFRSQLQATSQRIPELPIIQELDKSSLVNIEPSLGEKFKDAIYLPEEGQLDNQQLLHSLQAKIITSGGQLFWDSPKQINQFSPGKPGEPDWIIDCRGLGAREEWTNLRGVRGEILTLHAPMVTLSRPIRLIHPRYPLYIAPKENDTYRVGATEIESDDMSPMSVRSSLELLSAAYSVDSGFAEARIIDMSVQCRPALRDNLPSFNFQNENILQINGLYRHGFLIAPAMLDSAMQIITSGSTKSANKFNIKISQSHIYSS